MTKTYISTKATWPYGISTMIREHVWKKDNLTNTNIPKPIPQRMIPKLDSVHFRGGTSENMFVYMQYLNQIYPQATFISDPFRIRNISLDFLALGFVIFKDDKENKCGKMLVEGTYTNSIRMGLNNPTKRFLIIPLIIITTLGPQSTKAHSNIIIYDKLYKTLERFEPHGGAKVEYKLTIGVDHHIITYFRHLGSDATIKQYFTPFTLAHWGPQIHQESESSNPQEKGFCTAWCFWYAELRLLNPEIRRTFLINYSIGKIRRVSMYIRKYANFIENLNFLIDLDLKKHDRTKKFVNVNYTLRKLKI